MAKSLLISISLLFFLLHTRIEAQAQQQRQKLVIAGALSLTPQAEKFSEIFRKENPGIEIEIRAGGSNYAVNAARRGEIDIGLVSRNLEPAEKGGLLVESLGKDALVLLTYPGNTVSSLTLAEIRGIYLKKITHWSEVGGGDKGIIPLTREKTAAIHTIFLQELFGHKFDGQEKAFTIRASKEKILRTIKRIAGSIGYGIVRLEEAHNQGVKVLAIDGKLPTEENIREGIYPFIRPQYVIAPGSAGTLAREWTAGFIRFASRDTGPKGR